VNSNGTPPSGPTFAILVLATSPSLKERLVARLTEAAPRAAAVGVSDPAEAVRVLDAIAFRLLVVDVDSAGPRLEVLARLHAKAPAAAVLVLTTDREAEVVRRCEELASAATLTYDELDRLDRIVRALIPRGMDEP